MPWTVSGTGAGEERDHNPREVSEAAYARSALFERRGILMKDWARYLAQGSGEETEPLE